MQPFVFTIFFSQSSTETKQLFVLQHFDFRSHRKYLVMLCFLMTYYAKYHEIKKSKLLLSHP